MTRFGQACWGHIKCAPQGAESKAKCQYSTCMFCVCKVYCKRIANACQGPDVTRAGRSFGVAPYRRWLVEVENCASGGDIWKSEKRRRHRNWVGAGFRMMGQTEPCGSRHDPPHGFLVMALRAPFQADPPPLQPQQSERRKSRPVWAILD